LLIAFILPRIVPGNPVQSLIVNLAAGSLSPELLSEYERRLVEVFELNKPWYEQFISFILRGFRGDLGVSLQAYGEPVASLLAKHLPWTILLLVPAIVTAWLIGNYLGARASYKRGSIFEKITVGTGMVISQIPYYWLAMTLIFALAVLPRQLWELEIFPPGSAYDPTLQPSLTVEFIISYLRHYVLPFLSLLIPSLGGWIISMRVIATMELGSPYILYSDTLGVKDKILFRYVLRNSMLPQVTALGIQLGFVLTGQIITEQIFNYQGMGILLSRALGVRDYPVIQGVFMILIGTVLLANFIVDFVYVLIDPRIRLGHRPE
ncbi:MAG: ABC transporter permease, partial [Staphylothermus sp.]|nr:ABC transporter permease [Staphylothermus sp.]